MSVIFKVECKETRPGDGVFVTGGHDAIGNFSTAMAYPLTTTASEFPIWSSQPVAFPVGTAVQFKYIVQREDRSGAAVWETLQECNRTVTPTARMQTTVESVWGASKSESTSMPEPTRARPKTPTLEEHVEARLAKENQLLKMAESSVDAAVAEVLEASEVATSLMAREPMCRNFSQSLIGLPPTEEPVNRAYRSAAPEVTGQRGSGMKHIASFSALSTMAGAEEKNEARKSHRESQPQYQPKNLGVPVVVVTSECAPWSKTGGLGLVAASYSYEFPRSGHRTMVVSPKYQHFEDIKLIGETTIPINGRNEPVKYWHRFMDSGNGCGCDLIFVDHPSIDRGGGLYNDNEGREYPDNLLRFTILSLAALEAPLILSFGGFKYGDRVVFLANDWQAGLVPLFMCYKYRPHGVYTLARSIYVVHNLGYQGAYPDVNACTFFGVTQQAAHDLALGKSVNLSKGALICADRMLTVSPNYAGEIQTPSGGFGLQDFVKVKAAALRLAGILNGIDDCWNPEADTSIHSTYSVDNFEEGKRVNKAALQRSLQLQQDSNCVLIGFVGRLSWQKGVDIMGSIIDWLMQDTGNGVTGNAQLIMMGNGEKQYADILRGAQSKYPGRVCGFVGFDPKVEHQIMAGCDLFLMPSRYEPCGLPQMICQQYGTLPVVSATGGLTDSVKDISAGKTSATGFFITPLESCKMKEIIYKAAELYLKHITEFRSMQRNAMLTDFYWPRAMDEYERHIDFTLQDPATVR